MDTFADVVRGTTTNAEEQKNRVIPQKSSEADNKGYHTCCMCYTKFECLGVTEGKPAWCCTCEEQAVGQSGILFWCSRYCGEQVSNGPTDDCCCWFD